MIMLNFERNTIRIAPLLPITDLELIEAVQGIGFSNSFVGTPTPAIVFSPFETSEDNLY
jgi:hypothetical protein